jgi:hypothetical protein
MIVKTKNPIEYQDKNTTNIETRGGYDGEDVGGFVSFEGEEFIPFDGETELETFLGADGEIYHYSFNNDEYYNAKGQKVKDAFTAIKTGIGKVFGKDGFIRRNLKILKDKIVGRIRDIPKNVKERRTARQANRQIRKDARKLVQTEKSNEKLRGKADRMTKMDEGGNPKLNTPNPKPKGGAGATAQTNPNQGGGVAAPPLSKPTGGAAGSPPLGTQQPQQQQQQQQQQPIQDNSNFKLPLKVADANTPEENKIVYKGVTYNDEGFHDAVEFLQGANGGKGMFVLNVPPKEVVAITAEDGKVDYYQKKDLEGEGMTLTTKILIGVGAVVALGLITFLIIKRKK